jgi:hypothetical protein
LNFRRTKPPETIIETFTEALFCRSSCLPAPIYAPARATSRGDGRLPSNSGALGCRFPVHLLTIRCYGGRSAELDHPRIPLRGPQGYTNFVEQHGAAAAAALLTRYRALAREEIGRFGGAEITTEGDSFYVVFDSANSAVCCGLAITTAARDAAEEPIRVGVGIHAGETVEADGGYAGSAVNIAARICAQAGAGEVLVSGTVRAHAVDLDHR